MKLRLDMTDGLLLVGAGLVVYGVYLIFTPAAFILAGAGVIYFAIQIERGKPIEREKPRKERPN